MKGLGLGMPVIAGVKPRDEYEVPIRAFTVTRHAIVVSTHVMA